ncbi:hypothetical protein [Chitinophaga niabensis]|uniref:Uncharacterized protein n=1 Tax=Chitinophaga niabensis TaxID=536979 RepID=A0A1N6ERI0_9BACT|nr:hypothetical protein [Chitinophaga niabensis]SIN85702.1 hypothetical protein SAMN04488055_1785 [Chitinophaga niabensis]
MANTVLFVPNNININGLVDKGEMSIKPFKKDKLLYLLNVITEIPANNKDIELKNGFIPINATILKNILGSNYLDYIKLLLDEGIIECDNQYVVDEKSKGYRFTEQYQTSVIPTEITDFTLQKKLIANRKNKIIKRGNRNIGKTREIKTIGKKQLFAIPPYDKAYTKGVYKWYEDGGLEIDDKLANEYAEKVFKYKKADKSRWDTDHKTGRVKHPFNQNANMVRNIYRVKNGDLDPHTDDNVHRLHSVLTYSKKEIRHALSYKGESLVAIDLSNSQPYLSTILFNPEFWENKNPNLSISNLYLPITTIFPTTHKHKYFIKFLKSTSTPLLSSIPADLKEFIDAVSSGRFYEKFQKNILEKTGDKLDIQKELKPLMFMVLFTDNRFLGQKEAGYKRLFKETYPTVYNCFKLIKSAQKENLPILLQQIESYIFLKRIGLRIAKEHPNVPFWTIHDSVVTTLTHVDLVEKVAIEELEKCIGLKPSMKREYWGKGVLLREILRMNYGNMAEMLNYTGLGWYLGKIM